MFVEKRFLFLYVDTPLHAGSGRGLGAVDLPLQRERVTGYPMVQATGLKGRLRDAYRTHHNFLDDADEVTRLFGKAGEAGESHAGAIAPGDARLLLFPVRSLAGVFAWATSKHALSNFRRSAELAGLALGNFPDLKGLDIGKADAWICKPGADGKPATDLTAGSSVVLEEFSFAPQPNEIVNTIGGWLAANALPATYTYWRDALPKKLCILHEDAFRDFCMHATEVQTHIRIDPNTKTVQGSALWTEESLPMDTLLYAPIMASGARTSNDDKNGIDKAQEMLKKIADLGLDHMQLGGDETTGQGWISVRWWGGVI